MYIDNFTLIIPTKNRSNYLGRILDYYSNQKSFFPVIVCDSSEKSNLSIIEKNNVRDNIRYFHLPGYTLPQKLYEITKYITSPFVSLCADDDFKIIEAMEKCIAFLISNPSYSSAQGNYLSYDLNNKRNRYRPCYLNSNNLDIKSEKIKDRLFEFFGNYIQLFYPIFRTDCFSLITNSGKELKNLILYEFLMAYINMIHGKTIVLDEFYSIREVINNSAGRTHASMLDMYSDDKHKTEWQIFLLKVSTLYAKTDATNISEAKKVIDETINVFFDKKYARKALPEPINLSLKHRFKRTRPYLSLQRFYHRHVINPKQELLYIEGTKSMKGYPFYNEENRKKLLEINLVIEKFGK